MLKLFCGMILGSMMTMMLLGGAQAADQILSQVQTLAFSQGMQSGLPMPWLGMALVSLGFMVLQKKRREGNSEVPCMIKRLQRHCV